MRLLSLSLSLYFTYLSFFSLSASLSVSLSPPSSSFVLPPVYLNRQQKAAFRYRFILCILSRTLFSSLLSLCMSTGSPHYVHIQPVRLFHREGCAVCSSCCLMIVFFSLFLCALGSAIIHRTHTDTLTPSQYLTSCLSAYPQALATPGTVRKKCL